MRKTTIALAFTVLIGGSFLASCDKKAEASKEEMKEEAAVEKADSLSEYQVFKNDANVKIMENENTIAELKAKKNADKKAAQKAYADKVQALEMKNTELKDKVNNYVEDKNQSNWETFKREYNHDLEELEKAFKDLTVKNTK